jgi:hypothetical protein
MSVEEDARALEAVAVLLPQNTPERRRAEVEAFLAWHKIDRWHARGVVDDWWDVGMDHSDIVIERICRLDPPLARALIPQHHWMGYELKRRWLETLIADWRPGDGKTAAGLLRGYYEASPNAAITSTLLEHLPTCAEKDREALASALLRVLRSYWGLARHGQSLIGKLMVGAGTALPTTEVFTNLLARAVLGLPEKHVRAWSRGVRWYVQEHCPDPSPAVAAQLLLLRKVAFARVFEERYRRGRPRRKLNRRFVARWRHLEKSQSWIEGLPTPWLRTHFLARREKLIAGTAAWLRAEATAARSGKPPQAVTAMMRVGETLAVRVPPELARSGGFDEGQEVRLTLREGKLIVERVE